MATEEFTYKQYLAMNRIITLLVLCFSVFQLCAQNINGQVVDELQQSMPCANVLSASKDIIDRL